MSSNPPQPNPNGSVLGARAGVDGGIGGQVAELTGRLDAAGWFNIGFPGATDFDYTELGGLLTGRLLNNVGDPLVDGAAANQTKAMEREVVDLVADLFRADGDRWGYVTSGGSEGNLYGLWLARGLYPDAIVYVSDAAHYSVGKAVDLLGMRCVVLRTDSGGVLDYDDLADQLDRHRDHAAVVVANVGSTLCEAVDDVRRISGVLDALAVRRRFVHADAALSGLPLALMDPDDRPGFDFADGADAVTISGHKFVGMPFPCGVVVVRASHRARVARSVGYTASPDATIGGSRSGHAPLLLWYRLRQLGVDGLRQRAAAARELAAYTYRRLVEVGWECLRHEHAFTVALRTPSAAVTRRWVLASTGGWSHVITMPGVTREQIDAFIQDLAASIAGTDANQDEGEPSAEVPGLAAVRVPGQRVAADSTMAA